MILPGEKSLLSLIEIRALLGQNSAEAIFEYNAIVNAIPKQWFEWLRGENNDVYIRPPCEAMLYNVEPKQVKTNINDQPAKYCPNCMQVLAETV